MNIVRREPFHPFDRFFKDFDELRRRSLANADSDESSVATSSWTPAVDIREDAERFIISADIPGVQPKDIDISMENGVLTIRGERHLENKEEKDNYKRVEKVYGSFYRRFSLPDTADADNIKASGKDGVLQINIPKKPVAQPRRIEVH